MFDKSETAYEVFRNLANPVVEETKKLLLKKNKYRCTMKKKKIPMRRYYLASGENDAEEELVRIVRNAEAVAQIDPTGKINGRGICNTLEPDSRESLEKPSI